MNRKTLSTMLVSSLLASPVFGKPPEKAVASALEHVLVSVPIHKSEAETALPVTVLSGELLHQSIAATIGETLARSPGLANASFGPAVGQPVIRGQQGPRVTVLQNSLGSGDVSSVSADHAVAVEPILAERIEILRGPSTLLYGGGAIGGVVNVIDQRVPEAVPANSSAVVEVRHDSASDQNTQVVKVRSGQGSWALYANALKRESNDLDIPGEAVVDRGNSSNNDAVARGSIPNSDGSSQSFTLGSSYVFDGGYIGVAINRLDNEYGLPPVVGSDEGDIRLDIEQSRYDLRALWDDFAGGINFVRWNLSYADYQHRELEADGEVGTLFDNEHWENRLEVAHQPWRGWHGVVGLQLAATTFSAVGEESFIPRSKRDSYGLFVIEDYHYGDWLYELGLRLDRDNIKPDSTAADQQLFNGISGSLSTVWNFHPIWTLGLALSQSERAPSVEELYSNVESTTEFVEHAATQSIEIGSNTLVQEVSRNIDLTLTRKSEISSAKVSLFHNDYRDYIFLANSGQQQHAVPIFRYSQQDARFSGLEFDYKVQLPWPSSADMSWQLFGDYIRSELQSGQDVPRMPPLRLGSRLNYTAGPLTASLAVLKASPQHRPGDNEFRTEGYTRWDAELAYRFNQGRPLQYLAFIKLNNIGDEDIRYSVSYLRDVAPEAGRSVVVGLRVAFN